jgi:hypothetical protein
MDKSEITHFIKIGQGSSPFSMSYGQDLKFMYVRRANIDFFKRRANIDFFKRRANIDFIYINY